MSLNNCIFPYSITTIIEIYSMSVIAKHALFDAISAPVTTALLSVIIDYSRLF